MKCSSDLMARTASESKDQAFKTRGQMNRREFLQTGAGALSAMLVLNPRTVFGSEANSAVRIGLLGCGNRGSSGTPLVSSQNGPAVFALSSGILLRLQHAAQENWGYHLVVCTGLKAHLRKLTTVCGARSPFESDHCESEAALYRHCGLSVYRARIARRP
jgi:hypothetical protein